MEEIELRIEFIDRELTPEEEDEWNSLPVLELREGKEE